MKKLQVFAAGLLALLFTGCFKSVSNETLYVLRPYIQLSSPDNVVPLYDAVDTYAYYVDTTQWTIASYDDAVAHIITSKNGEEKKNVPDAIAAAYVEDGNENWLAMNVDNASIMVVAVDTVHKRYGYRQQIIGENLPKLYVSVLFMPWRDEKMYVSTDRCWFMFNDFGVSYLTNYIYTAERQEVELDPTLPLSQGVDLYAYYVDGSKWEVASYEDAVARVITSKVNAERMTEPDVIAGPYPSTDNNRFQMSLDSHYVMVVAVDTQDKLYAFASIELFVNRYDLSTTFTFRPWKTGTEYTETFDNVKWSVFNDFYVKPDPEE